VVVGAAGFFAVDGRFRGVAVDRFAVVRVVRVVRAAPAEALAARFLVVVAVLPEPAPAAAAAVGAGAALAAATGAAAAAADPDAARLRGPPARGLAAARALAAPRGLPVARVLVARAVERVVWRPRIPSISAASSAISSRTSARREVRLSRLFFVAFSRRPTRHVSSDRAAASANSSHSMWRASAAAGVMAAAVPVARELPVEDADPVREVLPAVLVVASVMSSPSSMPPVHSEP
jgi:hypothetical protein